MLDAIGPPVTGAQGVARQGGVERAAAAAAAQAPAVYDIPATPPPDLLAELDNAAAAIDGLAARGLGVHFAADEARGSVRVQLVGADGSLVRELSPVRLLDALATGSASGLAVNAVG